MGGRWEERYLVPTPQLSELERVLEDLGFERIEYATPFNKTIYFDNRECEVPFEYSIKARKYDSSPWAERGSLEGEDWIFELKSTDVEVWKISKKKVRKKCALEDLLKEVGKIKQLGGVRFSQPLEPRMGNCYLRTHFSRGDIRVTLDRDISYYEVLSGQLVKVGEEEGYGRVEVKIPTDSVELDLLGEVRRTIFEEFGGVPTISKKDMGHDFLRRELLRSGSRREVPFEFVEVEAKFTLSMEQQGVFHQIKSDFREGEFAPIYLSPDFPHTVEGGTIHFYVPGKYERWGFKKTTTKGEKRVIRDPYGLNCVLVREKHRVPKSPEKTPSDYKKGIWVYRKRKYFLADLLEGDSEGSPFCVTLDRSTKLTFTYPFTTSNYLYQLEVEGRFPIGEKELGEKVKKYVVLIAKRIRDKYGLTPTTLTKREWAMGVV